MVILRVGGVYSDIDTECRKPLDSLIKSKDTLVAGWEATFASPEEAHSREYVRTQQLVQVSNGCIFHVTSAS